MPDDATEAWREIKAWRTAERARLIAERLALGAEERAADARAIAERLDALLGDPAGRVVSAYWPFRGEPDLRPWLAGLSARGARTALPIVVAPRTPLLFRAWREGDPLARGVWNIPVPAGGDVVQPDIVIAPIVGFDAHCYRLGYGGGFFDRTLAGLPTSTLAIGVGRSSASMPTIRPQPFDIPMRCIVTEADVLTPP
ncbi:MAG: 5-formyltetrahydrofolate cyclo-ligase [Hyphomonadaceae bacterium]|nr:5-formyltetrahydrofolate cyclo-ligase [Hyphomonadaceae bacterium]